MDYYVIDVFAEKLFKGNPAGVCVLEQWIDGEKLQNIASENNLSETAFLVKRDGYYDLRWFTPSVEIDLCGHATIASAFVLLEFYEANIDEIKFKTMSGIMKVTKKGDIFYLDFPARKAHRTIDYKTFDEAFSCNNNGVYKAVDFLVVFDNETQVRDIKANFSVLKKIKEEAQMESDSFGIIITAKGDNCDFVSRFLAPNAGIDEDPVTGRAHCTLIPYWAERLGKTKMRALQLSKRGGEIDCEHLGERVLIGGKAVLYLKGKIVL
ncbi:MAG: PhzF family phenazine biosynthesis protein [Fibromonadales bacterium]|nr:PhzF family phenazine biosynthesis protein [Fibromonadales bacterium]